MNDHAKRVGTRQNPDHYETVGQDERGTRTGAIF